MKKQNQFSPEVKERAVRLVQEHRQEYPSLWAAVESIAPTQLTQRAVVDIFKGLNAAIMELV